MAEHEGLLVYADGAIGDGSVGTGVGAVVMDSSGRIVRWGNRRLDQMTNNEAEYAGLILALELAIPLKPKQLCVCLDSAVVVGQMSGTCGIHARALQSWYREACELARRLRRVTYRQIPRLKNRLADALANEALAGRLLFGP